MTLQNGIDFDARDGQPVSLLWALIVPEEATEEHLQLLAEIAGILSDSEQCNSIRSATQATALYARLFAA